MKKIVDLTHDLMAHQKKAKIAIDFTLGNGNDFWFMEQLSSIEEIYGFDIQQAAIDVSKKQKDTHKKIHFILDSHENFDQYVDHYDLGIFNFGYFPGGDEKITTKSDSSQIAIYKALKALNKKGLLILVVYIGHDEGKKEAIMIDQFIDQLDQHYYHIMKIKMVHNEKAPYIYAIEKVRKQND